MRGERGDVVRRALATAFFGLQAVLVARALFVESRDFCWAPHTTQVAYELAVTVDGRRLADDEVVERYGLVVYGWEAHAAANLIACVRAYESGRGKGDGATASLTYRVNGGEPRSWRWPER